MRGMIAVTVVLGLVAGCKREQKPEPRLVAMARDCSTRGDLACPRPILYVTSLQVSMHYFRDQLGFKIDWIDEPPDFGSVSRGDTQIFMCQRCQGHPGGWLWVFTPDVDKLYKELVRRKALIKAVPEDKRWGVREMEVTDPDGNVLRIASPVRDR